MKKERSYYLVKMQFLGFRYSGWQKQPNQKTVEGMVVKTLRFILPNRNFKVLGSSRTDAKVSALSFAFELFLEGIPITDLSDFTELFNRNLPADIKVMDMKAIDGNFNIIQDGKRKEYVYLFSFGEKSHPFCAPFMANILDSLDIELMKKATSLFEGTHDFTTYTARVRDQAQTVRHVAYCFIEPNTLLTANFFPEESYALHISAQGFLRYQVRMIMGALIELGKGRLSYADIEQSLQPGNQQKLTYVAPGSGLHLNQLQFDN